MNFNILDPRMWLAALLAATNRPSTPSIAAIASALPTPTLFSICTTTVISSLMPVK